MQYATICSEQPQISDYMRITREVAELTKQAADWTRKLEIAGERGLRGCAASFWQQLGGYACVWSAAAKGQQMRWAGMVEGAGDQ